MKSAKKYFMLLCSVSFLICTLYSVYVNNNSRIIGRGTLALYKGKSIVDISYFITKVSRGDSVTIASPNEEQGVKNVKITSAVDMEETYGNKYWDVDAGPVICDSCEYNRHINDPRNVYIIYPKIESAKYVERMKRSVPGRYSKETVDFALDVTGDAKADILAVRYCQDNPRVSPDSMSKENCLSVMKGYRFTDGQFIETYKSETPPYD